PAYFVDRVANREISRLLADLREKYRFVEEVAQLFAQRGRVAGVDGLEHFVRFLEHVRAKRGVCLFTVPWDSVRRPQRAHDRNQLLEFVSDFICHGATPELLQTLTRNHSSAASRAGNAMVET